MNALPIFKGLADPVRLRILHALSIAELSVAELVSVLGLPQSTVSRHLRPLRECKLVDTRRVGSSVLYHHGAAWRLQTLSDFLEDALQHLPERQEDQASVQRVLAARKQENATFFDRIAGSYGSLTEPGGGWQALAHGLAVGFAGKVMADVGCGEGDVSMLLAPHAQRVYAIDQSPGMLNLVNQRAKEENKEDIIVPVQGSIEQLPLDTNSVDVCFLSQVLHHAPDPLLALKEACRILKPGGRLILLDLVTHQQEWVRSEWADLWLGFDKKELGTWLEDAGFDSILHTRTSGASTHLPVLLCWAIKK